MQPPKCLRPTAGSEVATFGLKEEQVGVGLTFGTLALLFLMALPPAHTALEVTAKCIWLDRTGLLPSSKGIILGLGVEYSFNLHFNPCKHILNQGINLDLKLIEQAVIKASFLIPPMGSFSLYFCFSLHCWVSGCVQQQAQGYLN